MGFWKNIKEIFWGVDTHHEDAEYEIRFHKWAFGSGNNLSALEMSRNWNAIHGDKLVLYSNGVIKDDLEKMYELYDAHLEECKAALQRDAK